MIPETLRAGAVAVLRCADPVGKVALSHEVAAAWLSGGLPVGRPVSPPDRPARPERPVLLLPRDMPRRRKAGSAGSRIALLHALAHIELNAIDLAWDLIARFAPPKSGSDARAFHDDWVPVADEEASHFALLSERLAAHGAAYGDLPAHDGLWQAAEITAHDLPARLAVVPLVLEARGLDVTPAMIDSLDRAGDAASAAVLRTIYQDEIGHVAVGMRWFAEICAGSGRQPEEAWRDLVRRHFRGALKRPFNEPARAAAGFDAAFWEPLAEAG